MNVTTGTILCNARYKYINGYDCFVNMENKFGSKKVTDAEINNSTNPNYTPTAGYASTAFCDVSNPKISSKTLCIQNSYYIGFLLTDLMTGYSYKDSTLAFWMKISPLESSGYTYSGATNYRTAAGFRYFTTSVAKEIYCSNPSSSTSDFITMAYNYSNNTWYHIMICKKSTNIYLFVNGSLIRTDTASSLLSLGNYVWLRAVKSKVYYDDIVIVDGEALATSSFTLPTNTYLLDKTYDDSTLTYKNIMYPLTVREAKKILPDKELLKQY